MNNFKPLLIVFLLFPSFGLSAQNNCFENCWENFDSIARNVPIAERFKAQYWMLQSLVGCYMPAFSVETIDGKPVSPAVLKGKIVVMNFWFESCPPCRNDLPGLNHLVDYFKNEDVVFIAFGRDRKESIEAFLSKEPFHYLHVADCFNNGILDQFCAIGGFPANMVFDKEGRLVFLAAGGSLDEAFKDEKFDQLKPIIESLLTADYGKN
ncbi:MAG: TlpA family protein disulfide reductase [Lewinellaceae bacterium]|nr:TlpA family protein disulfide reductase [Saprospiraceae bacterium]MCB9340731.1 TlpA family protein disulfide reductase [Lewinellaceae bacterium]